MLEPLRGYVCLKIEVEEKTTKSGIILSDTSKGKPGLARVIAVGEGKIVDGKVIDPKIKENDVVVYKKYAGTEFTYDDEDYLIVDSDDILAIVR